jgi:1-phosphatidylinositol-4-phosphate 5-kinase
MSPEEAHREASERDAMRAAEAAASESPERVPNWNTNSRGQALSTQTPPIPEYPPPPPPSHASGSGQRPTEVDATMHRATHEVWRKDQQGTSEETAPYRVLRTVAAGSSVEGTGFASSQSLDQAGNQGAVLPVLEEAAEAASLSGRSRRSPGGSIRLESDGRPLTPAKDGREVGAGFGNPILSGLDQGRGPPTPPKTGYGQGSHLKPDSADSGYGVSGSSRNGSAPMGLRSTTGSQKSLKATSQLSRNSLDKALPPLPTEMTAFHRLS